jgi:signal transduction histidine kinase
MMNMAPTRTTPVVEAVEQVRQRDLDAPDCLLLGREIERRRIARELHDDLGQRLSLLSMSLADVVEAAVDAPPALRDQLRTVRSEVERLSRDLHRICHDLHPIVVAHVGLTDAIRRLCSDFSKQMRIEVEFIADDSVRPGSEDAALALYRVTQEALSNVARHSRSASATVSLLQHAGALQLTITDTGVGFDVTRLQSPDGLGLTSIRERASMLGAALEVRSVPSHGTTIDLRVPAPDSDAILACANRPRPRVPHEDRDVHGGR